MEKTIDRESGQKLYVQIYNIFKEKIKRTEWPEGMQIPTEDDLCRLYDISKATVRIAISDLVREGLIRRIQGKGTFVHSTPAIGLSMRTRLAEDMFGEGVRLSRELLNRGIQWPSDEISTYFGEEGVLYHFRCKCVVEDEPAFLEESYVPMALVPGIEAENIGQISHFDLIQDKAFVKISRVLKTIEVAEIKDEAADILRVNSGSPGILLHRLLMGPEASPIAYTRLLGACKKHKIQTEFEKIK